MALPRATTARCVQDAAAPGDVVLCGLGSTSRAWRAVRPEQATYYVADPMGLAPAMALGLSLSLPDRRVILLEGDGDLVMNLGVLLTIAHARPTNLYVVVFANGRYETGGGQPLGLSEDADLADVARSAGIRRSAGASSERELRAALPTLLARDGPTLLVVDVEPEASPYPARPGPWAQVEERAFFMARVQEHQPPGGREAGK